MLTLTQLAALEAIARAAGDAILPFYRQSSTLDVQHKVDHTPVTAADLLAHRLIVDGLQQLAEPLKDYPVLSEESLQCRWQERQHWETYWLIDPLDGTKEFLQGNPEFTVNIALIHQHQAVAGIVYAPAMNDLYTGSQTLGAYKNGSAISVRAAPSPLQVACSRSHPSARLNAYLSKITVPITQVAIGSSLKLCWLAEGRIDLYPRLGPTSEWDIAAGQAILAAAGGHVVDEQGLPLRYNTKASLLNPSFIAYGTYLPIGVPNLN